MVQVPQAKHWLNRQAEGIRESRKGDWTYCSDYCCSLLSSSFDHHHHHHHLPDDGTSHSSAASPNQAPEEEVTTLLEVLPPRLTGTIVRAASLKHDKVRVLDSFALRQQLELLHLPLPLPLDLPLLSQTTDDDWPNDHRMEPPPPPPIGSGAWTIMDESCSGVDYCLLRSRDQPILFYDEFVLYQVRTLSDPLLTHLHISICSTSHPPPPIYLLHCYCPSICPLPSICLCSIAHPPPPIHLSHLPPPTYLQDDLEDCGEVTFEAKIRVMPSCWFVLSKLYLRVDGVLIRCRETRLYHHFADDLVVASIDGGVPSPRIHMEVCWRELKAIDQELQWAATTHNNSFHSQPAATVGVSCQLLHPSAVGGFPPSIAAGSVWGLSGKALTHLLPAVDNDGDRFFTLTYVCSEGAQTS